MTSTSRLACPLLIATLCVVAPSFAQVRTPANVQPPNAPVARPMVSSYLLDLSESQDGGVRIGKFQNFAFPLKLGQPATRLRVARGDQHLSSLVATFDYADCTAGQEPLLERPLAELGKGDAAWVDAIDLEIVPLPQRDVEWSGGVCYGYRTPQGRWYWQLATTPLTYDASTDRVRARIAVERGPIDALKLVFQHGVPPLHVSRVTVTTRPIATSPQP